MEKIQVSLPEPTLKEMIAFMNEAGFKEKSEFGRHIITEWITLRKYGVIKAPGGMLVGAYLGEQSAGGLAQRTYNY